jgi:hypothetical protein
MKIIYTILVIIALVLLWAIGISIYSSTLEAPKYEVLGKTSDYEIRKYEPKIVAEITLLNDKDPMNNGFQAVAGYIFGDNTSKSGNQEIAMTTPVLDTKKSEEIAMTVPVLDTEESQTRTIAFVLPSKWTIETLPTPNNSNVKIREVPSKIVAAKRYFEIFRESGKAKAEEKLKQALKESGYKFKNESSFAYYDPPLTPFFVRRNEVLIELER